MKCINCKNKIPDGSKYCLYCGANMEDKSMPCPDCGAPIPTHSVFCSECGFHLKTGTHQRVLFHPKTNIFGYRVASIVCLIIALICALSPWLEVNGKSVYGYDFLFGGFSAGSTNATIFAVCYFVLNLATLAVSLIYIIMEAKLSTLPEKPKHITFIKISTTILPILLAAFFAASLLIFKDSVGKIAFARDFYVVVVALFIQRALIVKEYYEGYLQNRRMDALDKKYNSWKYE